MDRLRVARAALNLHQKELAEELGVTTGTWQNWESGKFPPSSEALERLAALGIEGHWLLSGEGEVLQSQRMKYERAVEDLQKLGLTPRMLELADRGGRGELLALGWVLMRAKEEDGRFLTFEEIMDELARSGKYREGFEVRADLNLLCATGQVSAIDSEDGFRYGIASFVELSADGLADQLEKVRDSVNFLCGKVLPATQRRDHSGWLAQLGISLPHGTARSTLEAFRSHVLTFANQQHSGGTDLLTFVVGVALDEDNGD